MSISMVMLWPDQSGPGQVLCRVDWLKWSKKCLCVSAMAVDGCWYVVAEEKE